MSTLTLPEGGATTVRAVAEHVVRLCNEVTAGVRAPHNVTPLFRAHLRDTVRRSHATRDGVARLRRLVVTSHSAGVYEVVAVCTYADRVTALGLQLTLSSTGRWQVTDVALPHVAGDRARACPTRRGTGAWDTTQRC